MKPIAAPYIPKESLIHHLQPWIKLLMMMILSLFIYIFPFPIMALALGFLFFFMMVYLSRIEIRQILFYIKPFLFFTLFSAALLYFSQSLSFALIYAGRILLLVCFSSLVILTTENMKMLDCFMNIFSFLRIFKIDPKYMALLLMLTLRLIPMLALSIQTIQEARKARGLKLSPHLLILPVLSLNIETARQMAYALEARGFH